MTPFTRFSDLSKPIEFTVNYDPSPVLFQIPNTPGLIYISFPPQRIKGRKHPGGRILRKARLRKKHKKYCLLMGYSIQTRGYLSGMTNKEQEDGTHLMTYSFNLMGSSA